MTAPDVDHVLAAIDGALDDWSVSGDAMRWSPDPATADALQRGGVCWNGQPLEFEGTRLLTINGVPL